MLDTYFIGIDAGTTSIKSVIFSSNGKEMCISRVENKIIQPEKGYSEQDMLQLWELTKHTIKDVVIKSKINPNLIKGIGVTGQGEGCWLIDEHGNPCRNAILWNDTRSLSMIGEFSSEVSDLIKDINGSIIGTGRTSTLLTWLSKNEPHVLEKAKVCFSCKDWIRFKLTGKISYEVTDASAGILDLNTKQVSKDIFEALGIYKYLDLIPEISTSLSNVGFILEDIAKECRLSSKTSVSAGFMDVVACPVGMGSINEGDVNTILGTACINSIVQKSFNSFSGYAGYTVSADNDNYLCLIGSMSGMQNIDWMCSNLLKPYKDQFQNDEDFFSFVDSNIQKISPSEEKIIYHPYINKSGERAPFRNPNARAGFFGISETVTIWHMVRSVYEGLALSIRDCMQGFQPNRIFLSGGGANSKVLQQIIADCLNCPVVTSSNKEIGAKGAAISVAIAVGHFKNFDDAMKQFQNDTHIVNPREEHKDTYTKLYKLYKDLQLSNMSTWDQRAQM